MKISFNWLKQYINISLTPEQVAEILTGTGLEVEGIEKYESIKGGLNGFVIGEVLSCEKHPNADKLSVTRVDIGNNNVLPIVCGAPNVAKGQKVVVATVGTTLYTSQGEFTIKKAKLRGEASEGMICAEDEIGIGDSHDGIIVLPENVTIGTPANKYFNVENDTIFEIGLTPNRIDGASHIGVARDLAAYLKQNGQAQLEMPSVEDFSVDNNKLNIDVEIKNPDACKRYSGVTISNVNIANSPEWLQNKLKAIGITPINNVVDITNYVLHELGHPLHAFDADKLNGNKIVVRTCPDGTHFRTLDDTDRILSANDLMICDSKKPACMAGIFGGADSGVSANTKNIFLESAWFNPVYVRKTAKRHGLNTDSSFRFERGADYNITVYALKRTALLIKEIAGGEISSEITDIYPEAIEKKVVKVYFKNIQRLIGKTLHPERIIGILQSLDFEVLDQVDEGMMLSVPSYRVDVTREADVIEEILRIYGYNNIDIPAKLNATLSVTKGVDNEKLVNTVSDILIGAGYNEIMSNSLTASSNYQGLTTYAPEKSVKLLNPLSNDLDVMRQTLLFSGLEAIIRNINRQNPNLQLFEFGNTYQLGNKNAEDLTKQYLQSTKLGVFITGKKNDVTWNTADAHSTFFQLKATVLKILKYSGIHTGNIAQEIISDKTDVYKQCLGLSVDGRTVAEMGIVNTSILKKFDIEQDVFFTEINWDIILQKAEKNTVQFRELPKYPEVKRDLSMILDKQISFEALKQLAFKTEKKYLKEVNIFDVYQGKNIPEGKKSYALSFTLQDEKATLKDKQIDKIMNNLMSSYTREYKAEIRQ